MPLMPFLVVANSLSVSYGGGRFVTVGRAGKTFVSTNGLDWISTTSADRKEFWSGNGLIYAHGRFVSVGGNLPGANRMMSSADAVNWTVDYPVPADPSFPYSFVTIAQGNGIYVAAAIRYGSPYSSVIYRSTLSKPYIDRVTDLRTLHFSGGSESRYSVEATTSLSPPAWNRIGEATTLDGIGTFEDKSAEQSSQRYYRLTSP